MELFKLLLHLTENSVQSSMKQIILQNTHFRIRLVMRAIYTVPVFSIKSAVAVFIGNYACRTSA
jgi:hypothetical protein